MSPPTGFSPQDQKLRLCAAGFQYIEDHLRAYRQDQVSLEDLSWYIATSKPRMYHLCEQTKRDCQDINLQMAWKHTRNLSRMWEHLIVYIGITTNWRILQPGML